MSQFLILQNLNVQEIFFDASSAVNEVSLPHLDALFRDSVIEVNCQMIYLRTHLLSLCSLKENLIQFRAYNYYLGTNDVKLETNEYQLGQVFVVSTSLNSVV